jgi:TPP-dependent pyruvate/acetoin dehydrogenase alpha subunit
MNISPINSLLLAGKPVTPNSGTVTNPLKVDAKEEFLEYARMSPAERLRAQILEEMELSEDGLAAMDPEARAGIEDEIKRRTLEALTGKSDAEPGSILDMSA